MTRVVIQRRADRDLDAIYDWITADDPAAAERHIRRLTAAARSLADFPKRGPLRPDIGAGARSIAMGRYLILYRVAEDAVEIVRFVHGARDVAGLLDEW